MMGRLGCLKVAVLVRVRKYAKAIRRHLSNQGENHLVYECRNCGTTIRSPGQECPYCGPTDVVTYELS